MIKKIMQWYLGFGLMVWGALAQAAAVPTGSPVESTDTLIEAAKTGDGGALGMARKLFGGIIDNPMSMTGDASLLGEVFGVLNGSLLVMGTVWVSYAAVTGTMMTSHEGQFLGKRMSSIWVPARLVLGVSSLVPVFQGFCMAQLVMMWAIQLGIGSGNLAWRVAVKSVSEGNALVIAAPAPQANLVVSVFQSNLCVASLNAQKLLQNTATEKTVGTYRAHRQTVGTGAEANTIYSYGTAATNLYSTITVRHPSECGAYQFPTVLNKKTNGVSADSQEEGITWWDTSLGASKAEILATKAYQDAFKRMDAKLSILAENYVAELQSYIIKMGTTDPVKNPKPAAKPKFNISDLDAIAKAYETDVKNQILAIQVELNKDHKARDFIDKMVLDSTQNGFINAGAFYMTMGTANSLASDAMSKGVKVISSPQPPSASIFKGFNQLYEMSSIGSTAAFSASTNKTVSDAAASSKKDGESLFFEKLKDEVCKERTSHLFSLGQCFVNWAIKDSNDAPAIVRIGNLGNNITMLGAALITAKGATQGLRDSWMGWVTDKVAPAIVGIVDEWLKVVGVIAEMLFFWGIIAAVWIPMIPAVIWIGGVASLLAVWVEAVVAAPLWAFAHLDTDGEGMGQRASTGYLFLVNVLFRPSLMVIGFMLGAMMCEILTTYVTNLYPSIIANASADSFTGLIKIVAYISAFVIILQMVVNVSFQAIRYVPDQVLGWLGGNSTNQVGANAADEVGGAAKGAFVMRGATSGDVNGDGPLAAAKRRRQAAQAKPGGADGAKALQADATPSEGK